MKKIRWDWLNYLWSNFVKAFDVGDKLCDDELLITKIDDIKKLKNIK